jgi:hypothetical protein
MNASVRVMINDTTLTQRCRQGASTPSILGAQRQGHPPRHPISRRKAVLPSQIRPDLNPIEQVFAKLKHLLHNAASRTLESLVAAIGEILGTFTPQECANSFANAGYGPT